MFYAVKILNYLPTKGGISDTIIPKTIMSGETLDYKKHLSLPIGQYCQVHEEIVHATVNCLVPEVQFASTPAVTFKEDIFSSP